MIVELYAKWKIKRFNSSPYKPKMNYKPQEISVCVNCKLNKWEIKLKKFIIDLNKMGIQKFPDEIF
jgi:hypothetical protein